MRAVPFRAFAGLIACLCLMAKSSRAAETQTVHDFKRAIARTIGYKYLLALPERYATDRERRWPLLVYLHGSGERGNDVWSTVRHGPPKILKAGAPADVARILATKFIVVSPQCPKNEWWDEETLLALLDEIAATQRVDPERVYLTGNSMGGFATWDLGLAHPERFAAIVPICGGGHFKTAYMSNTHQRDALRSVAVWAFHGAKDTGVPLAESQRMIAMLHECHVAEAKLTVYPDAEHDSWTRTYANPEVYTWLLRHARRSK